MQQPQQSEAQQTQAIELSGHCKGLGQPRVSRCFQQQRVTVERWKQDEHITQGCGKSKSSTLTNQVQDPP